VLSISQKSSTELLLSNQRQNARLEIAALARHEHRYTPGRSKDQASGRSTLQRTPETSWPRSLGILAILSFSEPQFKVLFSKRRLKRATKGRTFVRTFEIGRTIQSGRGRLCRASTSGGLSHHRGFSPGILSAFLFRASPSHISSL
jgi:hypothetical protein